MREVVGDAGPVARGQYFLGAAVVDHDRVEVGDPAVVVLVVVPVEEVTEDRARLVARPEALVRSYRSE